VLVFTGLLLIIYNKGEELATGKKSRDFVPLSLMILFAITLPIVESSGIKSSIEKNVNLFNKNQTLKCFSLSNQYLVSKNLSWSLFEDSFTKDSILLRADKCNSLER